MMTYIIVVPLLVLTLGIALAVFLMLRDANRWEEPPRAAVPRVVNTGRWVLIFFLIIAATVELACGACLVTIAYF